MVSDQEIASCVESLLLRQPSDPGGGGASVTIHGLVQQVEAKLGLDLSHKASFIRNHINLLLHHQHQHHHQQQQHVHPQHHQNQQQHPIPHLQPHQQHQQQQHYYPPHLFGQISQQQQQQQQHHHQQQSPFGNLPQRHELAFRCAPPPQMIPHHQNPQQHPQQNVQVAATSTQKPDAAGPTLKASQTGAKRRGGPGGLSKICGVSPELQAIVGEPAMPRTQIVKQLWAYIRKHNLQDPNNKRKIVCNDELRLVFETDCTDMFKMNKLLAKHIIPLEPTKESRSDSKRLKASEATLAADSEPTQCSVILSEALAGFLGIEEREMLQSDALKQVWDYIKTNQLEDPLNSMVVCDSKLQQLFGCEKLSSVEVSEMVSRHLVKQ